MIQITTKLPEQQLIPLFFLALSLAGRGECFFGSLVGSCEGVPFSPTTTLGGLIMGGISWWAMGPAGMEPMDACRDLLSSTVPPGVPGCDIWL